MSFKHISLTIKCDLKRLSHKSHENCQTKPLLKFRRRGEL